MSKLKDCGVDKKEKASVGSKIQILDDLDT